MGRFMSTFAGSNSELISITPLRDGYNIDALDPKDAGRLRLLSERIGRDLVSNAQLVTAEGINERELWTKRAAITLRLLVIRPFCRLVDVAEACRCNYDDAMRLIRAINHNRETAMFLSKSGGDAPYRRSTIQPIIESGAIKAFLQGTYRYPFTVGIYPAVSCMLSCSFCARARGEQYKQEDIIPGNELFRQLFAEAPRDLPRRFYLSGGLEPLTNPGLAEVVRFAAGFGHRMQLYTNAMMLTSRFLAKNDGLWHLDTLRISMYGADDETAQLTTSRAGVASRVIANAKDLVRAKSERGEKLRIGFNHVVQSGHITHLRKIGAALVSIADQSPDRRGINFLTLRENYAASGRAAISGDERERLRDELIDLQAFFVAEGMKEFEIDLGYGMRGLVEGVETAPVRRVAHTDMLGRGYPQISVVVDLLGDVYLYREAAFIGRVGADRYIIGRLTPEVGLAELLQRYLDDRDRFVVPRAGDEIFLDAFDHAVTAYLRQASDDLHFGSDLSGISIPTKSYQSPANLWR
jgi:dTDP-4-amino-4,6-dideoxy-D-glucose ammonia-lyase